MLIDGRSVPDGSRIEADLCIVGCGPAGITIARELAPLGIDLVVLESGGPERDPQADQLGAGESVGHPYIPLQTSRARGIGGTSLHWEMRTTGGDEGWLARPLDPIDFEQRPGVDHTGWPFTYADMQPYYLRAQAVAGLGPYRYAFEDFPEDPERPFALPAEVESRLFQRGDTTFSRYRNELAAATRVRVFHGATALDLGLDATGSRISEVRVGTAGPRRFTVVPRRIVLAGGGIENARLLLLSGRERTTGVGNQRDLVGRFFMERLSGRAGVLIPTTPLDLAAYRSHVVAGTRIGGSLSLAPDVIRREGLRNATFWIDSRPRHATSRGVTSLLTLSRIPRRRPVDLAAVPQHVLTVARDLPEVIRTVAETALRRETAQTVVQLGAQAEQAPNPDSRITLGRRFDRFGSPLARLDWRPTDADGDSLRRTVALLDASLRSAGIGRIDHRFGDSATKPLYLGHFHHMGTTRMDQDPAKGVVDAASRVHGVENLFIAGSSVFPTSGFANPTLTVVALSLRLADELKQGPWGDRTP